MAITTANCPSCGGTITFTVGSSIVRICEFCGSAIARTDRDLRNLGKVADLIDTQSPLRVGLEGRFEGRPFVLTGRVQIAHQAGGVWDEWYASFGGQAWGWLAEAQGRFTMTFYRPSPNPGAIPPVDALAPGQRVAVPGDGTPYVVSETGVGRLMGAQGEIPYAVQPGLTYAYADLSGPSGAFATLDYRGAPPAVFTGREVTLREMGISAVVDEFDAEKKKVQAVRLTCPHCNGPVDLRAPDASLRVTCPSCNSLLDVDKGNLKWLRALHHGREPQFPLGSTATFDGVAMTLVGFLVRGCKVEGDWYYWEEYLLYDASIGFRWLVNGEGGWFFVENVPPGDVTATDSQASFQGKRFRLKESVVAHVSYVRGEFYWRVEVGEQAIAADFVSKSETLSREVSGTEVNWSFGRSVEREALARAFDPRTGRSNPVVLPPPRVPTPPKPLPSMWTAFGTWLLLSAMVFAIWGGLYATSKPRPLLDQSVSFTQETAPPRPPPPPAPDSDTEVAWTPTQIEQTAVIGSFELAGDRNIDLEVTTTGENLGRIYLKLVNDRTGEVRVQPVDSSSRSFEHMYESPGPGSYTLYAIHKWVEGDKEVPIRVTVVEGVTDLFMPFFVSFLLLAGPGVLIVMKMVRAMFAE